MFGYCIYRISWWWLVVMMVYCHGQIQDDSALEYDLSEERPAGTFVGNVVIDSDLADTASNDDISKMHFSFLRQREPHGDYFRIEEGTGVIRTTRRIDRDTICAFQILCQVALNVMVQPGQFFQIIKVRVTILDLNDNSPVFPEARIVRYIPEGALPGTVFALPSAEDVDSGMFSIQNYQLLTVSSKFSLQIANNSAESVDILLLVTEKIDREEEEFFTMEVVATDGGEPPLSGSMMVDITIIDSNDNNPEFENATYNITVAENVPKNAVIVRVHATDPDVGQNGEIVYGFAAHTRDQYGHLFTIDNSTGQIQAKGPIDYEETNIYYLTVMAQDRGENSMPTYAKVVIHVEDINDYTPEITVNSLTPSNVVQVSEAAPPGTFVAHVSVVDLDAGRNGQVRCTIDSDEFELKKLFPTEYKVVTLSDDFDRESQAMYQVSIVCRDKGKPSLRATKDVEIFIKDENDHTPVFNQPNYKAIIRENNMVGQFVVQVNASDQDEGDNAMIRYALQGNADGGRDLLSIDPDSGIVAANAIFDYESKNQYNFTILALDGGRPQRTATTTLSVTIDDINDEAPHFQMPSYSFEVEENQSAGTFVGTVRAVDADTVPYNVVTYTIDLPKSHTRDFAVQADKGTIITTRELDREQQAVYNLKVIASNMGHPLMRNVVDVTVFVLDHNDNKPVITYPSHINNTVHVHYTTPIGNIITRIEANDADLNENAELNYEISNGDEDGVFAIDEVSGDVKLMLDLIDYKEKRFTLIVMVTDSGVPHKSTIAELHVHVTKGMLMPQRRTASFLGLSGSALMIASGVSLLMVIVIVLVLLITMVRCKQRQKRRTRKYNCRAQAALKPCNGSNLGPCRDGLGPGTEPQKQGNLQPHGAADWGDMQTVAYSDKQGTNKKAVTFRIDMDENDADDMDCLWSEKQNQQQPSGIMFTIHNGGVLDSVPEDRPLAQPHDPLLSTAGPSSNHHPHHHPHHPHHHHSNTLPNSISGVGAEHHQHAHHQHPHHQHAHYNHHPAQHYTPGSSASLGRGSRGATPAMSEAELELLNPDRDSETGSNTDSGRGASEEGDNNHHIHPILDPMTGPTQDDPTKGWKARERAYNHAMRTGTDAGSPSASSYGGSADSFPPPPPPPERGARVMSSFKPTSCTSSPARISGASPSHQPTPNGSINSPQRHPSAGHHSGAGNGPHGGTLPAAPPPPAAWTGTNSNNNRSQPNHNHLTDNQHVIRGGNHSGSQSEPSPWKREYHHSQQGKPPSHSPHRQPQPARANGHVQSQTRDSGHVPSQTRDSGHVPMHTLSPTDNDPAISDSETTTSGSYLVDGENNSDSCPVPYMEVTV